MARKRLDSQGPQHNVYSPAGLSAVSLPNSCAISSAGLSAGKRNLHEYKPGNRDNLFFPALSLLLPVGCDLKPVQV